MSQSENTPYARQQIGAFVSHGPERLDGRDHGPLKGLTFAVKDLFDIAGYKTGGGNPEWLDSHQAASETSPLVQRLLNSGATCVGKTVCDELFYSFVGVNVHYGTPKNVSSPGRVPGGSSSGSAAATAAGLCDFALGSDTGGSIRIPASFCGLFGLRPTHGRLDLSHAMPMAPSFDAAGWFARDAGIFNQVASVLLDNPGLSASSQISSIQTKNDPSYEEIAAEHLLIADFAFDKCDPETALPLKKFIQTIENKFPHVEHLTALPQGLDFDRALESFRIIQAYETWRSFGSWIEARKPDLGPGIRERMMIARDVKETEQTNARVYQNEITQLLTAVLLPGSVLCLPPVASLPPPVDVDLRTLDEFRRKTLSLVSLASLSGLPQLTIPATRNNNCAIGLSFMGWKNSDDALCQLASRLAVYKN